MQPCYYIIESQTSAKLPASIREATAADFEQTAQEHWQTDWRTDFIQDTALATKISRSVNLDKAFFNAS